MALENGHNLRRQKKVSRPTETKSIEVEADMEKGSSVNDQAALLGSCASSSIKSVQSKNQSRQTFFALRAQNNQKHVSLPQENFLQTIEKRQAKREE